MDDMDLDSYYRGTVAERLHTLAGELSDLAGEAASRGADRAGFVLADVATQLMDIAADASGKHASRELS